MQLAAEATRFPEYQIIILPLDSLIQLPVSGQCEFDPENDYLQTAGDTAVYIDFESRDADCQEHEKMEPGRNASNWGASLLVKQNV